MAMKVSEERMILWSVKPRVLASGPFKSHGSWPALVQKGASEVGLFRKQVQIVNRF